MSLLSHLAQVLLSLSLIFNGSGYAVASPSLASAHALHTVAPSEETKTAPKPEMAASPSACHALGSAAGSESTPDRRPIAQQQASEAPQRHSPDCCTSDSCRYACLQLAQAVIPITAFACVKSAHALAVLFTPASHASPALPHLIRPPIG